jgi:uncharacterized membrane protein
MNHCHPYYDLGIYGEALRLIQWNNLNPFIPGRFIHIFNDHFDPILIPFSFFERFLPGPLLGTTVEWLSIALCWFPIRHLYQKQKINFNTAVFSYAFIVLNHAMVDALFRPFHPTTWACLPLLCSLSFYYLKNYRAMLISIILLFSCREEFPLVGIMLGLVLLFTKEKKWGLITLISSLIWALFAFKIRPLIFAGDFSNYGGTLIQSFINNPLAQIKSLFEIGTIRMFLARTIPLLLIINFSAVKKHFPHLILAFIITSPIFGIRFASNSWGFHYGTAPVIALWFILLPALNESLTMTSPPMNQWRIRISWSFLIITFLTPVTKNNWDNWFAWGGFEFGHKQCLNQTTRLKEIKDAQKWITNSPHNKILLGGNLISTQLISSQDHPEKEFYFLGGPSSGHQLNYNVVMVEKPPSGDAWPIGQDRIKSLIENWRKSGLKIIIDNDSIFLAEGVIKIDQ